MPNADEIREADFDTQLRGLFQQAEQQLVERAGLPRSAENETDPLRQAEDRVLRSYLTLPQMFRPMVLGLEAVTRATGDNTVLLNKLDKVANEASEAQKTLPELIGHLREVLEQKNGVNQRMFDALHEELRGYKDGFLLESVHRPIIRDLISLFDDLSAIHRQMQESVKFAITPGEEASGPLLERLRTMEMNVEHNCEFILEVLARLEVTLMPVGSGKLDKHTQRVVALERATHPEQDMEIVRACARGFLWKDRVVRAEQVVIRRWKYGEPWTRDAAAS